MSAIKQVPTINDNNIKLITTDTVDQQQQQQSFIATIGTQPFAPTTALQNFASQDHDPLFYCVDLLENYRRQQQQQQEKKRQNELFRIKWRDQQFDTEYYRLKRESYEKDMRWARGSWRRQVNAEYNEWLESHCNAHEDCCDQLEALEREEDEGQMRLEQQEQQEQQQLEEWEEFEHGERMEYVKQFTLLVQQQINQHRLLCDAAQTESN